MKQREGDQPLPVPNCLDCIQDLVLADIAARKDLGISRYGTALQPHNGRDALRDAYEEALDLAMYLRQAIYERDNPPTVKTLEVDARGRCLSLECPGGFHMSDHRYCQ